MDRLLHPRLRGGVRAREVRGAGARANRVESVLRAGAASHVADRDHVSEDVDPDRGEQLARDRADRRPRRGLSRARALENVAKIVAVVLEAARQVGVAGAGRVSGSGGDGERPGSHPIEPVS